MNIQNLFKNKKNQYKLISLGILLLFWIITDSIGYLNNIGFWLTFVITMCYFLLSESIINKILFGKFTFYIKE